MTAPASASAHAAMFLVTRRWYCPAGCGKEDVTHEPRPHTRFHVCPKLRGLTAPLLPVGTKAKVEVKEWDDYVGKEHPTYDPERRRPISSVVTTRDNGQDVMAFAALATATSRGE